MELTHEQLLICSEEDKIFYNKCIEGLPKRSGNNGNYLDKYGVEIPYGSEAHVLQHLRTTIDIVKPKHILEIGLNLGWSSAMWLEISDANITSIDISDKDETIFAGEFLKNKYPARFDYSIIDSNVAHKWLNGIDFDLIFIDGGHDLESVIDDIFLAINLGISYLLFDDVSPRYGEVGIAIAQFDPRTLVLVKDMNNLRLYKNG